MPDNFSQANPPNVGEEFGYSDYVDPVHEWEIGAKQEFKAETDINTILRKYVDTGEWQEAPELLARDTFFNAVEAVTDYQDAMDLIAESDEIFNGLPAEIRARFNNSPSELIDWLSSGANTAEALELKIVGENFSGTIP
ncbi:MAG: internal scaffolding protein [Microviridae sp.]|nr:MAG: internal scaffolding protein [Microviridae sp.]